ncbi:MAG: IS21 family transposase [Desulfovibrio sp.]|nr:IS21 family transposase [Desulfovibrio sp.]
MYGVEEIKAVLECREKGMSQLKAADETGYSRTFVRKWWKAEWADVVVQKRQYEHKLDKYIDEIREYYKKSGDNCDVVLYELQKKHKDLVVSLRTIERYIKPMRIQKQIEENKIKQYRIIETRPGEYMQIDYGSKDVVIAGKVEKVHIFVAILAYSRKIFVKITNGETQQEWLSCIEEAFFYFGGIPAILVCDNARPLVARAASRADGSRTCVFTQGMLAFGTYWGVDVRACYPYYPQSKGKVESSVKYVKGNGIAEREFASREALQAHLDEWAATRADWKPKRLAGCRESVPARRFELEKPYLRPISKPRFHECREEERRVRPDGIIQAENAFYQLPLKYAKTDVRVLVRPHSVEVYQGGDLVQTFSKAADRMEPELLDAQCTFGAADPVLPSPASLPRGLAGLGMTAAEVSGGAAPAPSAAAGAQQSPSASAGAETASGASGGGIPASSSCARAQAGQSLPAGPETASGDSPGGSGSFARDLRYYEKVTGGFSTCSAT